MLDHRLPDGTFQEMLPVGNTDDETLIARHRVPGRAIEGVWVGLPPGGSSGSGPTRSTHFPAASAAPSGSRSGTVPAPLLDEVVALPVKDPFYIARNFMQLIELEVQP